MFNQKIPITIHPQSPPHQPFLSQVDPGLQASVGDETTEGPVSVEGAVTENPVSVEVEEAVSGQDAITAEPVSVEVGVTDEPVVIVKREAGGM